jgi:cellulose synthase/poly-beta-1,6-N-acetylglucosamine synthase-like glycosyltransferase
MLESLVAIITLGFVYELVSWCYRIAYSYHWVRQERSRHRRRRIAPQTLILIPVLFESDILEKTTAYFRDVFVAGRDNVSVVFITAEKEKLAVLAPDDTIAVAKRMADGNRNFLHLHFPGRDGKMAHQLNYAVRRLIENGLIGEKTLIGIYNADSRPEPETIAWVGYQLESGPYRVFQQYGLYTGNLSNLERLPNRSVLVAAALWQTRWSLGFEIFNALKQRRFCRQSDRRLNNPFNYCIGHGLFVTKDIFLKTGGFNESFHNEDAFLGLQLCDMGETIVPVPYFDISESPDSVGALYKQKANWFLGPLQAFSYANNIWPRSSPALFRKIRLLALSGKLFSHALFWIAGPTLMVFVIVVSLAKLNATLLLSAVAASFAFLIVPGYLAYALTRDFCPAHRNIKDRAILGLLAKGVTICYLLHGASAYKGLVKYARFLIGRTNMEKEKTEMKYRTE